MGLGYLDLGTVHMAVFFWIENRDACNYTVYLLTVKKVYYR
jgi:hypothetical protein